MSEIIFFQPRAELEAKGNLANFISHCRDNLTLYEDQGGFKVDKWIFKSQGRSYAMAFSKYSENINSYRLDPLDERFLTFAKARVRYTQSQNQVKSISNQMIVLRALHDALNEIHRQADILKTDGIVMQRVRELLDVRYPTSDLRYRLGQQLEGLYEFLRQKFIVPTLPSWVNPWPRGRAKAERTDLDSRKWQEERCPSLHQMTAIADCAMSPCPKAGECMTCKEHVCIKGMPKTLEAIKRLEGQVASQFEKAQADAADGAFGADRWVTHLGWKLAHIRTQRQILESEETPMEAILWIPAAHDPSPISRSLEQKGFKTKPDSVALIDAPAAAALMGVSGA